MTFGREATLSFRPKRTIVETIYYPLSNRRDYTNRIIYILRVNILRIASRYIRIKSIVIRLGAVL